MEAARAAAGAFPVPAVWVYGKLQWVMLDVASPEKGVGMGNNLGHRFWAWLSAPSSPELLQIPSEVPPGTRSEARLGLEGWEAEQLPVNKAPLRIPSAGKEKRFNLFHFLILSDVLGSSREGADTSGTLKSVEVCGASKGHSCPVYRSECWGMGTFAGD